MAIRWERARSMIAGSCACATCVTCVGERACTHAGVHAGAGVREWRCEPTMIMSVLAPSLNQSGFLSWAAKGDREEKIAPMSDVTMRLARSTKSRLSAKRDAIYSESRPDVAKRDAIYSESRMGAAENRFGSRLENHPYTAASWYAR